MKRILALALLPLTGCAFLQPPPLDIPDIVFAGCAAFPAANVPDVVQTFIDARNAGSTRADVETEFDNGCVESQPDESFVQACMICGDVILNFVYDTAN